MKVVLTSEELAELLQVEETVVQRLLEETSLPRFRLAGRVRFLTEDVIDWLRGQPDPILPAQSETGPAQSETGPPRGETVRADAAEGAGLVEWSSSPDAAPEVSLPEPPPPAGPDEQPFVRPDALEALGDAAADPDGNLDRFHLRDELVALGDALVTQLTQLTGGRLHPWPEEARRTSPWRSEEVSGRPITKLRLPWAEGAPRAPGFADRPRIELELTARDVALGVRAPRGGVGEDAAERGAAGATVGLATDREELRACRARGARIEHGEAEEAVDLRYSLHEGPPTEGALLERLREDLRVLVPLWRRAVEAWDAVGEGR